MAEAEAGEEIHTESDNIPRSQLNPEDVCQTILKDEQDPSHSREESDQDDYTTEEEEEETEEEFDDISEDEETQNTDNIRKIRKLANLFAMVKSMKEDANVATKSKSVSTKRRGNSEPVVCDY